MANQWLRNNVLLIGGVIGAIGLVLTLVSYIFRFANEPSFLKWYGDLLIKAPGSNGLPDGWNMLVMIVGPITLLGGGWYFGEQLFLRNKFERLLDTPKKSEFIQNKKDLETLAKQLPTSYSDRIDAKEAEFKSRRMA